MKRNTAFLSVMLLTPLLFVSCAAQFPFMAPAALSEATELKNLCEKQRLTGGPEVRIADSLYREGTLLVKAGKNREAFLLLDRSVGYYRVALSRSVIAAKEKEIAGEEQALAKTREDISAYQQVLQELKTMEQKQ